VIYFDKNPPMQNHIVTIERGQSRHIYLIDHRLCLFTQRASSCNWRSWQKM